MSVQMNLVYQGNLICEAQHGPSGTRITTDAPLDNGGQASAFSPTDLVATALGACMMTIMGLVAKKEGIDLTGTKLHITKDMVATPKRRIGAIGVTITLPPGLTIPEPTRRLFEQAADGCPVKHSLHPDVQINTQFIWE